MFREARELREAQGGPSCTDRMRDMAMLSPYSLGSASRCKSSEECYQEMQDAFIMLSPETVWKDLDGYMQHAKKRASAEGFLQFLTSHHDHGPQLTLSAETSSLAEKLFSVRIKRELQQKHEALVRKIAEQAGGVGSDPLLASYPTEIDFTK
jgi:hypothetical protein